MTLQAWAAHGCLNEPAAQSRDGRDGRDARDIDFEIECLLDAVLSEERPALRLNHRRQVQLAWVLLRHADFECALQVFTWSMQRRSARDGVERKVTVTTAFMSIVAEALAESGDAVCWRAFERDNPHLMDPNALRHWYPAGRLSQRVARAQFAAPALEECANAVGRGAPHMTLAPIATTFLPSGTFAG